MYCQSTVPVLEKALCSDIMIIYMLADINK